MASDFKFIESFFDFEDVSKGAIQFLNGHGQRTLDAEVDT